MEKKIRDHLKRLGCESNAEICLAYRVYLELFDVKLMHDVELCYESDSKTVYITARTSKDAPRHVFVPRPASEQISMSDIERLQNVLCANSPSKSITLACSEGDSTVAFYTFTADLVNPQNPECFTRQKTREERKDYLENEIKRKRNFLLREAYDRSLIDE